MKTMQSFDYSPSSKKQPKLRYYHPMKKIKVTQQENLFTGYLFLNHVTAIS